MPVRSVQRALQRALKAQPPSPADEAASALALTYASAIDAEGKELWRLGPRLLDTLAELGMTPKSRAGIVAKTPGDNAGRSTVDELRARRERRAAAMDEAAEAAES